MALLEHTLSGEEELALVMIITRNDNFCGFGVSAWPIKQLKLNVHCKLAEI